MMKKDFDIFISYSSADSKLVSALTHYLEGHGLRCWVAPRDIQAGSDYAQSIIDGIQRSSIMVVVLSQHSNSSHHVRNEVERAFHHQLAILPFRIGDIIPAQSLEYFLGSTHWLDAIHGNAEDYFERLHANCAALLKIDKPPKPKPQPRPDPVPLDIPWKRIGKVMAGVFIALLVIWGLKSAFGGHRAGVIAKLQDFDMPTSLHCQSYDGETSGDKAEGPGTGKGYGEWPVWGKFTFVYTGNWLDGKFEGKGTLSLSNGLVYSNLTWKAGYPVTGTVFWSNIWEYTGGFENWLFTGEGTAIMLNSYPILNCPRCKKYIGNWKGGVKDGYGTCYDARNNIIYQGEFKNDFPVGNYPK